MRLAVGAVAMDNVADALQLLDATFVCPFLDCIPMATLYPRILHIYARVYLSS